MLSTPNEPKRRKSAEIKKASQKTFDWLGIKT
jgi:hypothetical protein